MPKYFCRSRPLQDPKALCDFYHKAVVSTGSNNMPHRSNPCKKVALRPKCCHQNTAPSLQPPPKLVTGKLTRQAIDPRWVVCWAFLVSVTTLLFGWHILKDILECISTYSSQNFICSDLHFSNLILQFCFCMRVMGMCSALILVGHGWTEPWQAHLSDNS